MAMLTSRRVLYVGGLAEQVGEPTLRAAMIPFGPIKSIDIPLDYTKNAHKGFAFCEFEDPDDAAEALDNMDGAEIMGKVLNVSLSQPNQQGARDSSGGSHNKAVWSTDEWFQQQAGVETEADRQEKSREQADVTQLKEQVAMP